MVSILGTAWRVLTLRFGEEDHRSLGWGHLAFGLACTWVVGMGRYWDHPRAEPLQVLGVGSVVYVFVLSAFLWLTVLPLLRGKVSYRRLLTYVTLTAPPAILYAIPVERFMSLEEATTTNAWLLAVVAAWRVAMWVNYLARVGDLGIGRLLTVVLLPLCMIVAALAALNLEQVVFDFMAGFQEPSSADAAYEILLILTWVSLYAFPVLLFAYLWFVGSDLWQLRQAKRSREE